MEALEVLKINIAESFSDAHGSPLLYVVKESAMPGLSGWPIPHDAPYKKNFDFCIRASLEVWRGFSVEEEVIDRCAMSGHLDRCGLLFVWV